METPTTPEPEKLTEAQRRARIRMLNDLLRTCFTGGRIFMTSGIQELPVETRTKVLQAVQTFNTFTPENDPWREHDFGAVEVDGHKVFWKIDAYAPDMMHGSEDPADTEKTVRVLTILLAEEY